MTDEERQELCKRLREYHMADCQKSANEIERLVEINRDLCLGLEQAKRERNEARNMLRSLR